MAESQNRHDKASLGVLSFMLLAALVLINYAGTLRAGFIYDDHSQLVENVPLRSLRNIPLFFTDPAHTSGSMIFEEIYRPLRSILFAVEYQLWGLNPTGYHAVNIALHALNSFLVFLFLCHIVGAPVPALAAALLFAVHPALTENVCWICSQSDLLCMFFYLVALISYFRSREEEGARRITLFAVSLVALPLALLSKEMAVTFPAAIIATDLWREGFRRQLRKRWISYAVFIIITASYLVLRISVVSQFAQRSPWGETPFATAGIMAKGFAYYIRLLLFPFKLTVYPLIDTTVSLFDTETVLSAALVVCLIAAALVLRRRLALASSGIILFFIFLLPVSNIVPIKAVVGDRFIYIPSLGFFIVAAALFHALATSSIRHSPTFTGLMTGAIAILVFLLSVNTITRSLDWKDDFTLFRSAVEVRPDNPRARTALGREYFHKEEYERTKEQVLHALGHNPLNFEARILLGGVYLKKGLLKGAENEFRIAIEVAPDNDEANNSLGIIYEQQGKLDEALAAFQAALKYHPLVPEFLNNVGSVLLQKGETDAAVEYFGKALEVKSDYREATYNMALALVKLERYAEAVSLFEKLIAESPGDAKLLTLMGDALSEMDRQEAAINAYRAAITAQPSYTPAHTHLAELLVETGEYEQAISIYKNLLSLYPAAARQRMGLVSALEKSDRLDEAVGEVRIAARLNPQDASVRYKLAALLEKIGNESEAKKEYEIAERLKASTAEDNNQTVR